MCALLMGLAFAGQAALAQAAGEARGGHSASSAAPALQGNVAAAPSTFEQAAGLVSSAVDGAGELVINALAHLGIRYVRGGTSPESGFDCSGFVRHVYQNTIGLLLPRTSAEMAQRGSKVDKKELQPGDLVFFNTLRRAFSHVGIYVGDGKFVHAPSSGGAVRVEEMSSPYWQQRFNGARRLEALLLVGPAQAAAAPPATSLPAATQRTGAPQPAAAPLAPAAPPQAQADALEAFLREAAAKAAQQPAAASARAQ